MLFIKNKIYISEIFEILEKRKINLASLYAQDNLNSVLENKSKPGLIQLYQQKGGSVLEKRPFQTKPEILWRYIMYEDLEDLEDEKAIKNAFYSNHFDVAYYVYKISGEHEDVKFFNEVIKKKNVVLLKFFYEKKIVTNLKYCVKQFLENDSIECLKFCCKELGYTSEKIKSMYDKARRHNSINCIKYITETTIPREYILDLDDIYD